MQRPSVTSERCAPWWQHLALRKDEGGFLNAVMSFYPSNTLFPVEFKGFTTDFSQFKPQLTAWFQADVSGSRAPFSCVLA